MNDFIMDAAGPFKQLPASTTQGTAAAPAPAAAAPATDLSRQIEQAVEREPLDTVRCRRVFGDFYRCNWWSRIGRKRENTDFDWGGMITDHIRQSRFIKATLRADALILEDVVVAAPGSRSIV